MCNSIQFWCRFTISFFATPFCCFCLIVCLFWPQSYPGLCFCSDRNPAMEYTEKVAGGNWSWKCGSRVVATGRNAWTDEKQSRAEAERREKIKKREDQRRERVRRKKMQMREKVGKSRKHCVFRMIWGSGMSKNRLAKAAGAEPAGQMRDEKVHAVVAQST